MAHETPLYLKDVAWQGYYSREDGDLVKLFYEPALSRTMLYRRVTGYFSTDAFALAAKGLNGLFQNQGKMQLIVGCTLDEAEVQQIEDGYDLRKVVSKGLTDKLGAPVSDETTREHLGWLTWLIANGHLDVKLAIPKDANGKFRKGLGLYHSKCGLLKDASDDQIAFTGSVNETHAGWSWNWESFQVRCSWESDKDRQAIAKIEKEFESLWSNTAKFAEVMSVPEAVQNKLLEFLPKDDKFVPPPAATTPPEPTPPGVREDPDAEELRRKAWARIRDGARAEDGVMVAVETSAVIPWPHQLKAYKRMLDQWPFRLLIADEVGLGKTIEAGLIIRHAWISGQARRILILTPAGVMRQWQAELYEKFNLLVPIYTGHALCWPDHHHRVGPLEEPVGRTEWTKQPIVLASSHLMRRKDRWDDLMDAEDWDLMVVDEAHHARRKGVGTKDEKGPNRLLELLEQLREKAGALLLMTATPMQVHPLEIYDLLATLGLPQEWDEQAFLDYFDQLGKNPEEHTLHRLAKLFQVTEAVFEDVREEDVERIGKAFDMGKLSMAKVLKALREPHALTPIKHLSVKQREAAKALLKAGSPIRHRMSRHTRNLLREYHRKGLLDSPIAERDVRDLPIELSEKERALYEAVEDYVSSTYQAASKEKRSAVGFVMTIYRRRVASSFYALRRTLEKRLEALANSGPVAEEQHDRLFEDARQDERADEVMEAEEVAALEKEALTCEEASNINALLKTVHQLGTDSKALRLADELKKVFDEGYDAAIVFTQYGDTMDFLRDYLPGRLDVPIGCFSGTGGQWRDSAGQWAPCTKEEIKRRLKERQIRILICTDAAGEGLNLQTCGVLINFDLPWNPMKVEQRIGRIDRIGQPHEKVRIINMAYADTVEADVYFALSKRIGLFLGVVGKLQPILSQLPKEFEASIFAKKDQREKLRHATVSKVDGLVDDAKKAGFDIDEVSESDLMLPDLPRAPITCKDIEKTVKDEHLLPPGVVCKELDPHTFSLTIPGHDEPARVTTSPEVFDGHFQSHQFLVPDSPLYRELLERSGVEPED